jgi:hypothetical protein
VTHAWAPSWAHGGGEGGAAEAISISKPWRWIAKFTVVNALTIRVSYNHIRGVELPAE